MQLAWFRPRPLAAGASYDASDAVLPLLSRQHEVSVITEHDAHAFVVRQAARPWDLCVFELRNAPEYDYIWPYLFHYSGVLLLEDLTLHDSRARALARNQLTTAYTDEFRFNHGRLPPPRRDVIVRGTWPMLRAPVLAARAVVVDDDERRQALEAACPGARVRSVPACAAGPDVLPEASPVPGVPLRIQLLSAGRHRTVRQAIARAQDGGAQLELLDASPLAIAPPADVVLALEYPPGRSTLTPALAAMAHGKTLVVLEREATAILPALDPHTWRPRGTLVGGEPVAISLDPRDEEHALAQTLRRLAQDAGLRHQLGRAARAWWASHATPAAAARAWEGVLQEAVSLGPAPRPSDWPAHLPEDGAGRLRSLLLECGLTPAEAGVGDWVLPQAFSTSSQG